MQEKNRILSPEFVGRKIKLSTKSKRLFFAGVVRSIDEDFLFIDDRKGSQTLIAIDDIGSLEILPKTSDEVRR